MNMVKQIIYVDASGTSDNTVFKISLYDKDKNATHILQLKDVKNSCEAETYAIYYAVIYIKKHNYKKCHILCDNQSAVNNEIIQNLSRDYKIGITWIPREINMVADKISKLEPTLKDKEWYILKLFVDIYSKKSKSGEDKDIKSLKDEIIKLETTIKNKNTKIANQSKQITNLTKNN